MDRAFIYIAAVGWLATQVYGFANGMVLGVMLVIVGFIVEHYTEP